MRSLGKKGFILPMPVLMVATYNPDGGVDVMNMAWGCMWDDEQVLLNLGTDHQTTANIKQRGAFTLSVADGAHVEVADWFGMISAARCADKFARTGLEAVGSQVVDAPVVSAFPLTLECRVDQITEADGCTHVVGQICNTLAREDLFEGDRLCTDRVKALCFDTISRSYRLMGESVGQAWKCGEKFKE